MVEAVIAHQDVEQMCGASGDALGMRIDVPRMLGGVLSRDADVFCRRVVSLHVLMLELEPPYRSSQCP